ncbi:hypothetical protein [Streptomyces sp. GQFP]|uniref:hypothetical protein n=1 Tax=Streptomyces sp. GQFP TaxID=2907545 RepID=UPI001F43A746|nr:hypothetical protein [Streptomyces sp. GQFP]UIX32741.1 hypothetical protein LUX31_23410 [Streptomyces sp. GQFP]
MLRPTRTTHDRRGTIALTTSAAIATCTLAGLLVACGGGDGQGEGYAAVEHPASGGTAVAPTGEVTFVPLEGRERESAPAKSPSAQESRPHPSATGPTGPGSPTPGEASSNSTGTSTSSPSAMPAPSEPAQTPTPLPVPTPESPPPVGPARLTTSAPVLTPTDKRWCEKVTLTFHNTGGTPVRSGTVTFGTHIIDLLGIDWATIESRVALPVPIGAGETREQSWTVCVDAWRVPWGMRVETRVVGVEWA